MGSATPYKNGRSGGRRNGSGSGNNQTSSRSCNINSGRTNAPTSSGSGSGDRGGQSDSGAGNPAGAASSAGPNNNNTGRGGVGGAGAGAGAGTGAAAAAAGNGNNSLITPTNQGIDQTTLGAPRQPNRHEGLLRNMDDDHRSPLDMYGGGQSQSSQGHQNYGYGGQGHPGHDFRPISEREDEYWEENQYGGQAAYHRNRRDSDEDPRMVEALAKSLAEKEFNAKLRKL